MAKGNPSNEVVNLDTGEIQDAPELFEEYKNPGARIGQERARQINSIDDWEKFTGRTLVDLNDVLPDFEVLDKEEKSRLVGKDIILLDWRFNTSKTVVKNGRPAEFVSVLVMDLETSDKCIINDGSTGIYTQLKVVTNTLNIQGGLRVRNGLRQSDYPKDLGDGNIVQATTFYLSAN